jgi:two-component system, chemotaxis family, response regulator Rcp1
MTVNIDVLLVEDNAADVRLIREGIAALESKCRLSVVGDGEEALDFLRRRGKHAAAPRPTLMLLDLNLPRMDGLEVLQIMKSDPALKRIPVMILTSSSSVRDVNSAYDLGANSYLRKTGALDEIYDLMRSIEHYWLQLSALPTSA